MIATFRLVAVCSIVLLSLKTEIVQSAPSPQIPASEARNGTSSDKKPIRTRFPLPLPSFNLGGAFAHLPILHVPTTLQLNDQARKALVSFFGAARALQYLIQRELKTTAPKSDPTKANDGAQNVTSNSLDKNHTSSKPRRDISDQDNASSELVQDHSPEQLEAMEAQAIQEVLDKLPPETVNQVIQHLVQQEQALFQRQQEQQLLQQQQEQEFLGNLEHNFSNDQQHHLILEQNQPDILRKQEFLRHEQQKAPRQEVHELPRQQQKDFLQQQEVLRQRNFPSQEELFRNHEQKLPQQQRFLTQQQRQSPISQEQELLKQEFVLRQNQDRTGSSGAVHTRSVFERAAASPQEKPSQPRQRLILRYAAPDEEEEILKSTVRLLPKIPDIPVSQPKSAISNNVISNNEKQFRDEVPQNPRDTRSRRLIRREQPETIIVPTFEMNFQKEHVPATFLQPPALSHSSQNRRFISGPTTEHIFPHDALDELIHETQGTIERKAESLHPSPFHESHNEVPLQTLRTKDEEAVVKLATEMLLKALVKQQQKHNALHNR